MCVSRDTRRIGFQRVDGLSTDTLVLGRHKLSASETWHETIIWIIYLNVDDCVIIAMVQVSLDLRCSRISWMLILYFDLDPCCLFEVSL